MTPMYRILTKISNYILFFLGIFLLIMAIITWIVGRIDIAAIDIDLSINPYIGFGLGILSLFFFNISSKYLGTDD